MSAPAATSETPAIGAHASARPEGLASFPPVLKANPYQRLLYEQLAARGFAVAGDAEFRLGWLVRARRRVRFLHFHWPQPFWRHERGPAALRPGLSYLKLALFAVRLAAARALGYRIAWTVHQVYPHEVASRRLDRLGARVLAGAGHVLLAHDESTRATIRSELGRCARRAAVVPHGSYVGVYPPGRAREAVRAELGLRAEDRVLLCFGHVRGYKDVDFLLDAFAGVATSGAVLLVAGSVHDEGAAAAVRRAAAADPRVRPMLRFVPDEEVAELFGAADAAVVARNDGGTSASIILALSLGLPVVAAARPAYEDLLDAGAAGWLFEPGDVAALTAALERAAGASGPALAERAAAARRSAARLGWSQIGARTAALLRGYTTN